MAKSWRYQYGNDTIIVENKGMAGSELYINGELVDICRGASIKDRLAATLKNGDLVIATVQGMVTMGCTLLINNELHEPVEVK